MPNRILKETINESRGLSEVSPFAQDLYKRLITYADDYGRFNTDTQLMIARLFPRELDSVTAWDISEALFELIGIEKIEVYTSSTRGGEVYAVFPNWADHQRLRQSRAKCPEPGDTSVNDWALRRFVSIELKIALFERDKFTCQECGRSYELPGLSTRHAMRLLSSALHVDHIVPVCQGGRATEENLRLLCASCNFGRPKRVTCDDLVQLARQCEPLPQVAASGRKSRPESNPIQSESESESESNLNRESESATPNMPLGSSANTGRRLSGKLTKLNHKLGPELRTPLANVVLTILGTSDLANTNTDAGDAALYAAHEAVIALWGMDYRSEQQLLDLESNWYATDFRGQKNQNPTSKWLVEHASTMRGGSRSGRNNGSGPQSHGRESVALEALRLREEQVRQEELDSGKS